MDPRGAGKVYMEEGRRVKKVLYKVNKVKGRPVGNHEVWGKGGGGKIRGR